MKLSVVSVTVHTLDQELFGDRQRFIVNVVRFVYRPIFVTSIGSGILRMIQ